MPVVQLHDKAQIESCLRRNVFLHLYEIGDLDDFFWPHTTWYAAEARGEVQAILLLYAGGKTSTLLALSDGETHDATADLLARVAGRLPNRFYAHLSPGLDAALRDRFSLDPHGEHLKMGLIDKARVAGIDARDVKPIGTADTGALLEFYTKAYPRNWFEPRMLEAFPYSGIHGPGGLQSVAGIHVYSVTYRVAALGNIATLPEARGKGLATATTAHLCQALLRSVDHVGLNVKADNQSAIRCYERLGFERVAMYGEFDVRAKP